MQTGSWIALAVGAGIVAGGAIAQDGGETVSMDQRQGHTAYHSSDGNLDLGTSGAGIAVLRMSGAAHRLGLEQGDVITAIDGKATQTPEDLMQTLRTDGEGKHILTIRRGGRTIALGANKAAWSDFLAPTPPQPPRTSQSSLPPIPPAPSR